MEEISKVCEVDRKTLVALAKLVSRLNFRVMSEALGHDEAVEVSAWYLANRSFLSEE